MHSMRNLGLLQLKLEDNPHLIPVPKIILKIYRWMVSLTDNNIFVLMVNIFT